MHQTWRSRLACCLLLASALVLLGACSGDRSTSSSPTTPQPATASTGSSSAPRSSTTAPGDQAELAFAAVELGPEDPMPGGTYVIVENVGAGMVSLGCWRVRSEAFGGRGLFITDPDEIAPGAGVKLAFDRGQVANPDRLELIDDHGTVVDRTDQLEDTAMDDQVFSRTDGRWALGRPPLPDPTIDGRPATSGGPTC